MLGQVANARGSFAPLMWAPIANNVVVIVVFAGILAFQSAITIDSITDFQVQLLGWGTTLGVVIQALILIPVVKRSGIHLRLTFGVKGLGKSFGLAGWTLVYVLISPSTLQPAPPCEVLRLALQLALVLLHIPALTTSCCFHIRLSQSLLLLRSCHIYRS